MNIWLLMSFTIVLFSSQCFCYSELRITAVLPRGFRACIASKKGMELFQFHAYTTSTKELSKVLEGTVTKPSDGLWCYRDNNIVLHFRDEIVYRYKVLQFGQMLSGNGIIILQAADFVDESGDHTSISTSPFPSYTVESTTESVSLFKRIKDWWLKPRGQKQSELVGFKNRTVVSFPMYPVASAEQGHPNNGESRLISIATPTSTEKAKEPGDLHIFSQKDIDYGASSTFDLGTRSGVKFETQENSKNNEMEPKSPQTHTVNEYVRSSESKLNANKGIGGDKNNITGGNTEILQIFSIGVPEKNVSKSHNARGMAHDTHIVPQQPPSKVDLTSIEQQAVSEIFNIAPKLHVKDGVNNRRPHTLNVNFEDKIHSEDEHQKQIYQPFYAANVRIDKKEKNENNDNITLIVSPAPIDATLKLKDDRIPPKGFDEYDYTVNRDIININVVINSKATDCNTSTLFDLPNEETKPRVLIPDKGIASSRKTKSCEALLYIEKKLSEGIKSSYQDCVFNDNVIQNDLTDSKKESKILIALLKETLLMINYLKVNSTNKLVLKSSIPIIDYKQVLREVIQVLLDVEPSQYNIIQWELESYNIVKFELGAYSEKLLLFLNGRIKLQGSNFQLIDYDA